ncbi:unnamed protein product [Clonostachys solani]|uniref:Phosphatidylinositol-specific phospholipase C X domain-containing protein n=1 Tax=Clonostachys solani TaxID=160281 RepID=A0A9N9Z630_9HYPO|nr:unnamed protein product [Clonostachys solani]
MANLTIRNLTIHPIELVSIERFESKKEGTGDVVSNAVGHISGFFNATKHQSSKLVTGDSREQHDVSFHAEPFRTQETDIRTADGDREILRLIFRWQDKRHEVDIPSPDQRSSTMKRIDPETHEELTAVYVANGALVAIYSSSSLNSWMDKLHNDWPLGSLSIPGTHNSPTCHKALPSVRCQAVSVREQLDNGVRFLDIRVSADPEDPTLSLVHSAFPVSLTGTKYFGDMLDDIYEFLDQNGSETVIMSVKREGNGKANDEQMSKHLKGNYIDKKPERWATEPRVPRLGEVRGRILLVRRFNLDEELKHEWDGRGFGIDAAGWPDNCEDGHIGDGFIRVQDFYEVSETENVEKKIDFSRGQLERAAEQQYPLGDEGAGLPAIFVNFLSASNFFNASCWPERIAAKVNPAIVEYLCIRHGEEGKGPKQLPVGAAGTGVVVTDWVGANGDWDLIRCIVGMNAKLQHSQ